MILTAPASRFESVPGWRRVAALGSDAVRQSPGDEGAGHAGLNRRRPDIGGREQREPRGIATLARRGFRLRARHAGLHLDHIQLLLVLFGQDPQLRGREQRRERVANALLVPCHALDLMLLCAHRIQRRAWLGSIGRVAELLLHLLQVALLLVSGLLLVSLRRTLDTLVARWLEEQPWRRWGFYAAVFVVLAVVLLVVGGPVYADSGLSDNVYEVADLWELFLGIVFVIVVMVLPHGIVGTWNRLWAEWRIRRTGRAL